MSNIIEEVKKQIEAEELEAKKAKIKKMLVLIQNEEKTMAAEQKAHENYVEQKQKRIAELKEKLEKEDYSEVEAPQGLFISDRGIYNCTFGGKINWQILC